MKKFIYSIVFLLPLLVSSCKDTAETIRLILTEPDMKIIKISSKQLYAGERFTITGQDFANSTEFQQVYVGGKACTVLGCTKTEIKAVMPKDAVDGNITLQILDTKLETDSAITVLKPVLSTDDTDVYPGNDLKITGKELPTKSDSLYVTVGGIETEISDYVSAGETDSVLTITIPQKLNEETADVKVSLYGVEIFTKTLTILPAPKVQDVSSSWVKVGEELVIEGSGFSDFANNVDVSFPVSDTESKTVAATVVSNTQLKVVVPEEYTGGELSILFGKIPAMKIGTPKLLKTGDVTSAILVNSVSPFEADGAITNKYGIPVGWTAEGFSSDALYVNGYQNVLIAQTGWDKLPNKTGAKLYQVFKLPKGSYTFTINITEFSESGGGRSGAWVMITKGHSTIPDISDKVSGKSGWWPLDESNIVDSYRISDNPTSTAYDKELKVTVDEETEMTIGFVVQFTNNKAMKIKSIKVTMK